MSTTVSNVATVQAIYEAFGRGGVPAILGHLSPDVTWEHWADNRAQQAGVPWMQARSGPEGALEFFKIIGTWVPERFEVVALMDGGDRVAAEVVAAFTLPTGRRFDEEEVHVWRFDGDGKVASFRHYLDTAKHIEVAQP